jgi:uncharacterized protein (DUF1697 family)
MPEWVLLPRAINLGARNKVGMPQLREALTAAGFSDVRTYVQSGNIVASSRHRGAAGVARAAEAVIRDGFGVTTSVVVRSPRQIRDVLAWCPFPDDAAERPTGVQVIHLDAEPSPAAVATVTAEDWSPDRLVVRGPEVCVCYAAASRASRLQHAPLLKRLGVGGTARNWRTLVAIEGLLSPV